MNISEFIKTLNSHSKGIYESGITQMTENNKTVNWLLGLSGGALIFSFNKYGSINESNLKLILLQATTFILIILVGFLYRYTASKFKEYSNSILKMFDFLRIELELVSDFIEKEVKNEKLDAIFSNYLNGDYFQESDQVTFYNISTKQTRSKKQTFYLSIIAAILMLVEFSCFFIIILKK